MAASVRRKPDVGREIRDARLTGGGLVSNISMHMVAIPEIGPTPGNLFHGFSRGLSPILEKTIDPSPAGRLTAGSNGYSLLIARRRLCLRTYPPYWYDEDSGLHVILLFGPRRANTAVQWQEGDKERKQIVRISLCEPEYFAYRLSSYSFHRRQCNSHQHQHIPISFMRTCYTLVCEDSPL